MSGYEERDAAIQEAIRTKDIQYIERTFFEQSNNKPYLRGNVKTETSLWDYIACCEGPFTVT